MSDSRTAAYALLDFNAPLSDARAAELIAGLLPLDGAHVVDLGCGWAELLLRTLAAAPTATGIGVDRDTVALARGRENAAARGLSDRVSLVEGDVAGWAGGDGEPFADAVIAIGVSHAWGGARPMLQGMRRLLRPDDRLLIGDGFWEQEPTPAAIAALNPTPDEFRPLAHLVDLALASGYTMVNVSVASLDEWDSFESRWLAGKEQWLSDHADATEADDVRRAIEDHRSGWLHGYRSVLGFAYLTLVAT